MLNGSMEHAQLEFDESPTGVWSKIQEEFGEKLKGGCTKPSLAVE